MYYIIRIENLTRTFHVGDVDIHALRGASLVIGRGEFVTIMGSSGSGKSTLTRILKALVDPNVAFVTGPASAKITVAEFFDYRCPYCKASLGAMKQLLDFGEGKRVRFTLGGDLDFSSINLNNSGLHTLLLKCSNNLLFKVILDFSRGAILFVKGRGQIAIM